jgi:hypothetical protein
VLPQEVVAEGLNEVSNDRCSGGAMEKDDFVHGDRTSEPGLIDVGLPLVDSHSTANQQHFWQAVY